MVAKRKKILLRHSKSSEDGSMDSSSALHHIKQKVDNSVHAMNLDIIDSPITPSPSGDRISLSAEATTTHESGVITSPRSLEDFTEEIQWSTNRESTATLKQKAERTYSDIVNHNDMSECTTYHNNSHGTALPENTKKYQDT